MPVALSPAACGDGTGVGANVILAAGVCACRGETGLLAPLWGGPAPETSSSFAAGGICKVHPKTSF